MGMAVKGSNRKVQGQRRSLSGTVATERREDEKKALYMYDGRNGNIRDAG